MPLLIVILGILLLFLLIARFKLNAFIAFIIVSLGVGLAEGMDLEALVSAIDDLAPEAVAVNLLFGFLRPEEERRIAKALGTDRFVCCGSEVLPEPREYERGIATWLNAAVGPVIDRYLARLDARLPDAGVAVMQSAGTTIDADQAGRHAVRLLLSANP